MQMYRKIQLWSAKFKMWFLVLVLAREDQDDYIPRIRTTIIFEISAKNLGKNQQIKKFDFIIVGGGSTGSVIANRLSENPHWNILLLEAGSEPSILADVPAWAPLLQFTNYNWGYLTEEQANVALGIVDRRLHWPRGKVLGGSSVINFMIYTRGNKEDYDNWEGLGNSGWSYKHLLPLFRKIEDSNLQIADPGYHNIGGPLSVEDIPYRTKLAKVCIAAAQQRGHKYVDYNGKNQLGVSYIQTTTRRGRRCSAKKAFLQKMQGRPNLTIKTKSRVTKILINPKTKRAYGVEFVANKQYHKVKVTKEVILSAGVFNSAQLLMLSGIGPEKHLKKLNISVKQNLPVGQKLYDHPLFIGLSFKMNQSIGLLKEHLVNPQNILPFLYNGSSPIAIPGGIEGLLFFKTNVASYKSNKPDIELLFINQGLHTDRGLFYKKIVRITDEMYDALHRPLENLYAFSIWPILLHPRSYGNLTLKSKNPFHWPKLYGNYFTDAENKDIETLIVGIREIQRIASTPAFQKYGIQQDTTIVPGCKSYKYDSDEYWECALRHLTVSLYHQTSTCKMGPPNDPEAVVDSRLKVYGIQKLRVADTSIFPTTISGHTNAPAYIVGEKASEFIKKDWAIRK